MFRVGSGFWVSGSWFRVPGSGFRIFGFRASGVGGDLLEREAVALLHHLLLVSPPPLLLRPAFMVYLRILVYLVIYDSG